MRLPSAPPGLYTNRHAVCCFTALLCGITLSSRYPVPVILGHYATHKTADEHTWLEAHPDLHFHFIPTSSSWMHAVEGLFAKWARGCLQRGNFASLQDLVDTMHQYLEAHNRQYARPFRWRKDPAEIMAARKRGYH